MPRIAHGTIAALWSLIATLAFLPARAQAQSHDPAPLSSSPAGVYVKVLLPRSLKTSRLKAGESVEGSITRDVYASDHKLFSSGTSVRLTVDHLEQRRRTPNDHWPWIVKIFTPRHETYPVFHDATVLDPAAPSTLPISVISISHTREIHPPSASKKATLSDADAHASAPDATPQKSAGPTMILEAFPANDRITPATNNSFNLDAQKLASIAAGTHCRIVLLNPVSASKSKPGDTLAARLLEPVIVDSQVILPAGSIFEGKVLKRTPPRTLSRSGSLNLTFTAITLPEGNRLPISASLSGAVVSRGSHTRLDREGVLHGEHPGRAWMAINIGMTAGVSKEVDDGMQLLIEALISSATDASTAGTSRIVSSCVSGIYLATRHGRDVVLPRFSEMEITIDRAIPVSANPIVASSRPAVSR